MCEHAACEEAGGGRREEEEQMAAGRSAQPKTRTPHKDVGKYLQGWDHKIYSAFNDTKLHAILKHFGCYITYDSTVHYICVHSINILYHIVISYRHSYHYIKS